MAFSIDQIDHDWTLFLDRDGVINIEKDWDYINTWDEFIFYDGVKEALRILASRFKYIFVVTNQRGIAKGVTRPDDLATIHRNMLAAIRNSGGRIDRVYHCPDLEPESFNRKPNPGMGLQAKQDYEAINFNRSIIVGNNLSDMEFGRKLGCHTIFLPTTNPEINADNPLVDAVYNSLLEFAKAMIPNRIK